MKSFAIYLRLLLLPLLVLLSSAVWGAAYTLPASSFPPCQGTWTSGTNSCNAVISFSSGDTVTSNSVQTVSADGGFVLRGNVIGSSTVNITLRAAYNEIRTAGSSATTIYGSVLNDSGLITLSNVTINGSIQTSSGTVTLTSSSVSGSVTGTGNGNLTSTSITGNVSFTNGLTASGTTFSSSVSTNGNANLTGGSVAGTLTARNGVTTNGTNLNGKVTATNGSSSITGGTINADIEGSCCTITINDAYVTGNISNNGALQINNTTITGAITGGNTVTLSNGTIYGDVSAGNWNNAISGTGNSKVYGTCTPSVTNPTTLCDDSPVSTCFTDNFNRSDLGTSNWAVTSRNGSFGVPKTVGSRLRLTDNTGNVATGATLQRLLPAANNFVQVQFKYYGYSGNGADGVALIFSDASITPQPGGYGGSLGYAQSNGISGFAGGWLAVAMDEYGNFSNPTETRSGGPGQRQDSVSIRGAGSGTTGYRYLAGTAANLNPGIDVSGTTAGPGHTYRITLDSRTTGKTMVMVERNTGSGFTTLISSFDVRTFTGQSTLPSDFFMSLTGSTGGSNNIHELDDLQVCATRLNPIGQQIDHIRIEHDGSALTCQPGTVTVKACMDADCTSLYPDPVTVTLSPTAGWVGSNSLTLTGGIGTAQYRSTTPGSIVFGVTNVSGPLKPLSTPKCANGGAMSSCPMVFYESGFIFDVPHMVANTEHEVSIQAVRKDATTQLCVPAFQKVTRTLKFWSTYGEPNTGTRAVAVNGGSVATASPGTDVSLAFDEQAKAKFMVRYTDAGQMALNASYMPTTGNDSGLVMLGSDSFVSRPVGLCVYSDSPNSDCAVGDASCSKFVAAGDSFRLRVGGVAWQSGDTDGLCIGNLKTPNYRQSEIVLTHSLVAPGGGELGSLKVSKIDIAAVDGGEKVLTDQSISEVGVFTITATPPTSYLNAPGVGNSDGSSDNSLEVLSASEKIGRFYPASFQLADPMVSPVCNGFTYAGLVGLVGPPAQLAKAGQPFSASGSLSAVNRSGSVTKNYVGAFAKLKSTAPGIAYADPGAQGVLSGATTNITEQSVPGQDKRGYLEYSTNGLAYQFSAPRAPYSLEAEVRATDSDGVTGSVKDEGRNPSGQADSAYLPSFYLGQARIGNAHGSELQGLALPFRVNYFNGSVYALNTLDSCTAFKPVVLDPYQRTDSGSGTPALADLPYVLSAGVGAYQLSAPGAQSGGSQWVRFTPAPSWLKFDWNGDGTLDDPAGLATFGIYKGAAPLIFRREVYR
ncbi:DUF6701 domain-containing protein [Pseudomonas sp. ML96]|uniref:DUF6701 domain-containing protein n=1 Tax=Pseudomonas sp. ML96 TaxID=1523503 RepID=UPI000691A4DF|nr:DUF6701 domain-containing protein [Pseudomonas sp. ML96]